LNAFILRFAGDEGFLLLKKRRQNVGLTFLSALVSQSLTRPQVLRAKKDQTSVCSN
jgi:hypothetical protein